MNVISAAAQEWRREINQGIPDLAPLNETLSAGQTG